MRSYEYNTSINIRYGYIRDSVFCFNSVCVFVDGWLPKITLIHTVDRTSDLLTAWGGRSFTNFHPFRRLYVLYKAAHDNVEPLGHSLVV